MFTSKMIILSTQHCIKEFPYLSLSLNFRHNMFMNTPLGECRCVWKDRVMLYLQTFGKCHCFWKGSADTWRMSLVLEGQRNVIFADTWRMSLFWKGSVMLYLQTFGECHCF